MALLNLVGNGNEVMFDDCEQTTGTMIEAKGPTFTDILRKAENDKAARKETVWNVDKRLLDQSERQVEAAGPRPIRWYFADSYAAEHARELFERTDDGRQRIAIEVAPAFWRGK